MGEGEASQAMGVMNRLFGKPVKVTPSGVNVAGRRYKIKADGPGPIDPRLKPLRETLETDTTPDGGEEYSMDVELSAGWLGDHEGTLEHETLRDMVKALVKNNEWEGTVKTKKGDVTITMKQEEN